MENIRIKYFTPSEAKKTLPLVKQIVNDILNTGYQLKSISDLLGSRTYDSEEAIGLADDLKSFIKELEQIGCYYKDWNFSIGLVDFPAKIDGEEVYLCWRSDEDDIYFYHGIYDGYAGRKEIPKEFFENKN